MKTLAYDCGNPVQYACGHSPAVLFYLLDRHAPLAMTKGTKWIIPYSLTTPGFAHPSNGGELGAFPPRPAPPCGRIWLLTLVPPRNKFPSAEGWHEVPGWSNAHRPFCGGGGARPARRGGGELSPEAQAKGKTRVTSN